VGFDITTDQNFCNRQILEKKWEYNETVHQLVIDFKVAYYSVRREVLYDIVIEFGLPMKQDRLIQLFNSILYLTSILATTVTLGQVTT
jgi:hypothetical protein